jgi:flagellar motor protein MotB
MAALLKQQAALRVLIVGHADNQGGADANVALSQQRAQAMVGAGEGLRNRCEAAGGQGRSELCAGGKQ